MWEKLDQARGAVCSAGKAAAGAGQAVAGKAKGAGTAVLGVGQAVVGVAGGVVPAAGEAAMGAVQAAAEMAGGAWEGIRNTTDFLGKLKGVAILGANVASSIENELRDTNSIYEVGCFRVTGNFGMGAGISVDIEFTKIRPADEPNRLPSVTDQQAQE
ncbi:MAG: hypothetical protein V2B18_05265 [Pseudomonadota bacterium]